MYLFFLKITSFFFSRYQAQRQKVLKRRKKAFAGLSVIGVHYSDCTWSGFASHLLYFCYHEYVVSECPFYWMPWVVG